MNSRPPEAQDRKAGPLAAIDVAILAGGLGTRLRGVLGETPKVLAPVGGKAFLDHLFAWLKGFGARRIVLCLGFRAEKVLEHVANHIPDGLEVVTVVEPEPLGTAGGLRHARDRLVSDPVLVMNGDTFVDADLAAFVAAHRKTGSEASILATAVPSMARYGRLEVDAGGMIRRFAEKDPSDTGPGLINAGLYLFSAAWLDRLAATTATSLERDMLTAASPGTYRAVPTGETTFIDIGTPESLSSAATVMAQAIARLHPSRVPA
jgi:NDP-sugar pyrophosphorylase family protein